MGCACRSCLGHIWGPLASCALWRGSPHRRPFPPPVTMSLTTRWPSFRNGTTRALVLCSAERKVMGGGRHCGPACGAGVSGRQGWFLISVPPRCLPSAPQLRCSPSLLPHPWPLPPPLSLSLLLWPLCPCLAPDPLSFWPHPVLLPCSDCPWFGTSQSEAVASALHSVDLRDLCWSVSVGPGVLSGGAEGGSPPWAAPGHPASVVFGSAC